MYVVFSKPMRLFVLSKQNIPLAAAEAWRSCGECRARLEENLLFLDTAMLPIGLAFTREVLEVLIEFGDADNLVAVERFAWSDVVESPYAVRVRGKAPLSEKDAAGMIWRSLEAAGRKPSVSLESPKCEIHLLFLEKRIVITRLLWRNDDRFSRRRAHLRPRNHPTSLHPTVARAMINLAGPVAKIRTILDPFCGSGGILLEAGLAGRQVTGTDTDATQVERAEQNTAYFNVDASVLVHDAMRCDELTNAGVARSFDAIVTDLPLGRSAKLHDREQTFRTFFSAAARAAPVLVVALDTDPAFEELFSSQWRKLESFDWYVHKGLTKRIYVLERLR